MICCCLSPCVWTLCNSDGLKTRVSVPLEEYALQNSHVVLCTWPQTPVSGEECLAGTLGQGVNCLRAGFRGPGVFGTLCEVFLVSQLWRNSLRQPYQSSWTDRIQPARERGHPGSHACPFPSHASTTINAFAGRQ